MKKLSRREFLRAAGAGALSAAVGTLGFSALGAEPGGPDGGPGGPGGPGAGLFHEGNLKS